MTSKLWTVCLKAIMSLIVPLTLLRKCRSSSNNYKVSLDAILPFFMNISTSCLCDTTQVTFRVCGNGDLSSSFTLVQ